MRGSARRRCGSSWRRSSRQPAPLALEEAAEDFEPGGESVTNAVIMVTDGEGTCGGDSCQVAGELNPADIQLASHVVGFAPAEEQREAVRCIADERDGKLLDAAGAESLSEAVFATLERQLEITAAGYVGGHAFALLPACEGGELSVIAIGPYEEGINLLIVVCNETGEDVEGVEASAVARDGNGRLLGQGAPLSEYPYVVVDGGVTCGHVYLGVGDLTADAAYEVIEIDAQPLSDEPLFTPRHEFLDTCVQSGVAVIMSR